MALPDGLAEAFARQGPLFVSGLGVTLQLLVASTVIGLALAVPVALARVSRNRLLSVPATGYAYFFRGTPLLVQIFIIYYGLPQFDAVREAALAVGMPHALMLRRVILPRAFRIALPALSNEVVLQLKATSLASTVTLIDLTGVGRRLAAKTYTTEGLFVAGALYILLTFLVAQGFRLLEGRFNSFQRP